MVTLFGQAVASAITPTCIANPTHPVAARQLPTEQHRLGGRTTGAPQLEECPKAHHMGDTNRRPDHSNRLTPTCRAKRWRYPGSVRPLRELTLEPATDIGSPGFSRI